MRCEHPPVWAQGLCDDAAVLANNDSEETVSVSRCWKADKIVFARTLSEATWTNTTVVSTDAVKAIQKLEKSAGKNLTVLGSGSLVTQLAQAGLIDEYQTLLDPIIRLCVVSCGSLLGRVSPR